MRRTASFACDQSIQTRSEATPSFVPQSSRPSRARSAMHGMPLCSKRAAPLLRFFTSYRPRWVWVRRVTAQCVRCN